MTDFSPVVDVATPKDLSGWIPVLLPGDEAEAHLLWQFAGKSALDDSFFFQTAARLGREYANLPRRRTDLSVLLAYAASGASLKPDAFVFHIGRCGSTVLSNALRAIEGAVSLSEPEPITVLLMPYTAFQWPYALDKWEAVQGDLFRGAVAALGQCRLGVERRYFIKFAEWNPLSMKFVRSLYPDVPFIYMYRDPYEVMSSFLNTPPNRLLLRMMPAEMFGMDAVEARSLQWEEYCARVVGHICAAAVDAVDDHVSLLNYSELGAERLLRLFSFFGIDRSEVDMDKLETVLLRYAKDARPEKTFVPDSESKLRDLSDLSREMIARYVEPAYVALEQIRATRGADAE